MLEFDEFLIRSFDKRDQAPLFQLIDSNRDRLTNFLPITAKENGTPDMTATYIESRQLDAKNREVYAFAIVHQTNQEFAGFITIKNIDWHAGDCEIGYFIDQHYEGQGITSRAVRAISDHCFSKLRLRKVVIVTSPDNLGSVRVAEKNGFVKTSKVADGHTDADGINHEVFRYELRKPIG